MTRREKILAAGLGGVLVVAVGGFGGYGAILLPIQEARRNAEKIEGENDEAKARLRALQKDLQRLDAARRQSLPADADLARQEYEAALGRLLREARVPTGYTVRQRTPDGRAVPELAPKKPAYSRLAFEVTMKKVDLGTLTDFLRRYYELGLLHQITRFQVKRTDAGRSAAVSGSSDRADLDVTLVTEAAILDGADPRRTLLPVPPAAGAALGAAGYRHLTQSPAVARGLAPDPAARPLADPARDYLAVLAKNPFHGPLPPPAPPPAVAEAPPPPPKEDISPFIKLTGLTRRSDGTAQADVKDTANNFDYHVDLRLKGGETVTAEVTKYFYLKDRRKKMDAGPLLDISDEESGTARKFRVVGLDDDGLVLTESAAAGSGEPARGGRGSGRGPTPPPPHPAAAVAGGAAAGVPQERVYVWRVGQSLKKLTEVAGADGRKMVERAAAGWPVPGREKATPVAKSGEGPVGD